MSRPNRKPDARTYAERQASGRKAVHLRLPATVLERLDTLCRQSGYSRCEMVETMIDVFNPK